jgi:hypothetical protein
MPMKIPNLDDLTFEDLVEEARAMLPHYDPEWTNHNASDPGVTLIELLAYFTDLLIYRLNHVSSDIKVKFLELLTGRRNEKHKKGNDWENERLAIRLDETIAGLGALQRAVTAKDYEQLVKNAVAQRDDIEPADIRVRCFEQANLEASEQDDRTDAAPGHISVVVALQREWDDQKSASVLADIRKLLEPKRLLTTRLHVVPACYLWLSLKIVIQPQPGIPFEKVQARAIDEIEQYVNPHLGGGPDGTGWPFGRTVYLNELYAKLDQVPSIDYVHAIYIFKLADNYEVLTEAQSIVGFQVGVSASVGIDTLLGGVTIHRERLMLDSNGMLTAVKLYPFELIGIDTSEVVMAPAA